MFVAYTLVRNHDKTYVNILCVLKDIKWKKYFLEFVWFLVNVIQLLFVCSHLAALSYSWFWKIGAVMSVSMPVKVSLVDRQVTYLNGNITTSLIDPV